MRIRPLVLAFAVVGIAASASADPVLDFTGSGAKQSAFKTPHTAGWSFTTTTEFLVDGFGLFDAGADLLSVAHEVGLWDDSTGTLIASVFVDNSATPVSSTAADLGQWLFTSVTPFLLAPGDYVVAALFERTGAEMRFTTIDTVTTIPGLTYTGSRNVLGAALTFPSTDAGVAGIFGPNLSVRPVPEPATLLLFGTGLVGIGVSRLRKRLKG